MRIKNWLISTIGVLLFTSCNQLITEVDPPQSTPKLVVYSVISPQDTLIEVKVYKSHPLFSGTPYQSYENKFPPLTNATVLLSGAGKSVTLLYDTETETYTIDAQLFNITPGGQYELKVMAPDLQQVTAECTVPPDTPSAVEITHMGTVDNYDTDSWYMEFNFKDLKGEGHYYTVNMGTFYNNNPWTDETYLIDMGFKGEQLITDKNMDESVYKYKSYPINLEMITYNFIWISLSLVDENYYKYKQSVNSFQGDNPFSEPTPIFSNITDGLGMFAGINTRLTRVEVER
ncbi:hypothetical protein MASR1M74_02490 [Lentimicrobium sp.]